MRLHIRRLGLIVGLVSLVGCNFAGRDVLGPRQPESGPGGSDYSHEGVLTRKFESGAAEYWLFFPDHPQPETAPFVVFLHGWTAMQPRPYGAWIQHLVKKGHIVVYPRYQSDIFADPLDMAAAASTAITAAWVRVNREGPVRPRTDKIVWIGHSFGGTLSAVLAGRSQDLGLPPPAAVLSVQPGGHDRVGIGDLAGMPADARILLVVGDNDRVVGDSGARAIADGLRHLPAENVELVTVRTDERPFPSLVADHFAPLAINPGFPPEIDETGKLVGRGRFRDRVGQRRAQDFLPDALDFFAFWKFSDALLDASFRGEHLEYAFGNTDLQKFMGELSNGAAVQAMTVSHPLAAN